MAPHVIWTSFLHSCLLCGSEQQALSQEVLEYQFIVDLTKQNSHVLGQHHENCHSPPVAMEDMIVAKTESYISTYYKKLKKTLPLKSDQEELQTIV